MPSCYDTRPRFSRFHLKDRPFSRLLQQARDNEEHTHPDSHARNGILGIKYWDALVIYVLKSYF